MSRNIKINLLPKTLSEKQVLRNITILFGVLLVAVIAGGLTYWNILKGQVAEMEQMAADAKAYRARVEAVQNETKEIQAQTAPILEKVNFINNVLTFNTKYPEVYEKIARWTYEKIMYTSMEVKEDGVTVEMTAMAKTIDDVGRYLLNMYRATDLFSEVKIDGIPGYPEVEPGRQMQRYMNVATEIESGEQISGSQAELAGIGAIERGIIKSPNINLPIVLKVTCKLKNAITPPSFSGSAASTDTAASDVGGAQEPMPLRERPN